MVHDMEDNGQFIEIDIIIDSNIKKNDDIILPKYMIPKKANENQYIYVVVNVCSFIMICVLFYNIYVSPPFK
jgi:hypothetical protein